MNPPEAKEEGWPRHRGKLRAFAAVGFFASGALHFVKTDSYERIMPPWLPFHRQLIWISGAAEIAGAAAITNLRTRRVGGALLFATVIAVFPANIHMTAHSKEYPGVPGGRISLLARLPVQGLFLAMVKEAAK